MSFPPSPSIFSNVGLATPPLAGYSELSITDTLYGKMLIPGPHLPPGVGLWFKPCMIRSVRRGWLLDAAGGAKGPPDLQCRTHPHPVAPTRTSSLYKN